MQDRNLRPEEVRRFFEKYGEVRDVYLPLDYYTRRARGFGFVEFSTHEEAKDALDKANGADLSGSNLHVDLAREGRKRVSFNIA